MRPGDETALASALDHVLAMPPERLAGFGARARAAVLARFTVGAMQAATLAVYDEVLANEGPGLAAAPGSADGSFAAGAAMPPA